jgi:hypothetical protein
MAIDPKLPIPVYFQLKTLLLEEILVIPRRCRSATSTC